MLKLYGWNQWNFGNWQLKHESEKMNDLKTFMKDNKIDEKCSYAITENDILIESNIGKDIRSYDNHGTGGMKPNFKCFKK